ncbi:MAG: universal stress protein [Cyanobacteria bacterium J06555_13]
MAQSLSAEVWVLHVAEPEPEFVGYTPGPQSVRDFLAKQFHQEHRQIQEITEKLRTAGLEATALLVQGPTVETILKEASKLNAAFIVMGSHGKGMVTQLFVGSVGQGVLHKAECPVLIIPTRQQAIEQT